MSLVSNSIIIGAGLEFYLLLVTKIKTLELNSG